jgi:hypothetical protein
LGGTKSVTGSFNSPRDDCTLRPGPAFSRHSFNRSEKDALNGNAATDGDTLVLLVEALTIGGGVLLTAQETYSNTLNNKTSSFMRIWNRSNA